MKLVIIMSNAGAVLDQRTADSEEKAVEIMIKMIEECGELHEGDVFTVTGLEPRIKE